MKRINIHGGPGVGKTTIAHKLFSDLKILNYDIEFVHEYVKLWARQNKRPQKHDQIFLFAMQQKFEHDFAEAGVSIIVSECPLLTSVSYAINTAVYEPLIKLAKDFEKSHPSINILLQRKKSADYVQAGRYETPDEATGRDIAVGHILDVHNTQFLLTNYDKYDKILSYVTEELEK